MIRRVWNCRYDEHRFNICRVDLDWCACRGITESNRGSINDDVQKLLEMQKKIHWQCCGKCGRSETEDFHQEGLLSKNDEDWLATVNEDAGVIGYVSILITLHSPTMKYYCLHRLKKVKIIKDSLKFL